MAKKLGFADLMFKNIKVEGDRPVPEDILREMNRGSWSTGYTGQSPERLKAHMRNQHKFDLVTLRAPKDDPEVGGDYYGLPWPCWGTPEIRHPGSPILYNADAAAMDGGNGFRARFGTERNGQTLLAEGSYLPGSEIQDGYPEFTMGVLKKLGWDKDLTPRRTRRHRESRGQPRQDRHGVVVDGSFRRHTARCTQAWLFTLRQRQGANRCVEPAGSDPCPSRTDLHARESNSLRSTRHCLMRSSSGCRISAFPCRSTPSTKVLPRQFPLIVSSGRLVEYEGGGEETRSNRWLAELQQDMFIEINPADAAERGIKDGGWVWVTGAENSAKAKMKALVTERVGKGVTWMPFHFGGWFGGEDLRSKYPPGTDPIVLGESANTIMTYGYDPATGMQEPKVSLCQVRAA